MKISNKRFLKAINRNIKYLVALEENSLFISQYKENEQDKATIVVALAGNDTSDEYAYLSIRRLLNALKYRLEKETNLELDFNLKIKEI